MKFKSGDLLKCIQEKMILATFTYNDENVKSFIINKNDKFLVIDCYKIANTDYLIIFSSKHGILFTNIKNDEKKFLYVI